VSFRGFRTWLAAKLLGSEYATIRIRDDEIDAVAKQLGVDPDLLLEVRADAIVALRARGHAQPISNSRKRYESDERLYQYQIRFPGQLFPLWTAECDLRGVTGATLLRSMIHAYLLGEAEPVSAPIWSWQGKVYRERRGGGHLEVRSVIPHGAKRALMRRAKKRGQTPTAIVRALVLDAMGGGQQVPLVTAGMMFDDESRYNLGDSLPA